MAILQIQIKLTGLSPFFFVNNFSAKYEYSTFTCESTDIRALSAILKGVVDKRIETSLSQADLLKYITAGTEGSTGETGGVSDVDKESILQSASQDAKTKADAAQAAAMAGWQLLDHRSRRARATLGTADLLRHGQPDAQHR